MTKYKASDVVLVKDGRLSNDVEVYLASDTDQRDAVRLAEIARLREALSDLVKVACPPSEKYMDLYLAAMRKARAALKEGEGK